MAPDCAQIGMMACSTQSDFANYCGAHIDIDYCAGAPCLNGGTCTYDVNGFTCACASGYVGGTCASSNTVTFGSSLTLDLPKDGSSFRIDAAERQTIWVLVESLGGDASGIAFLNCEDPN